MGGTALVEQACGDGIELASGGADVVEYEDIAAFGYGRIWDFQHSAQLGR